MILHIVGRLKDYYTRVLDLPDAPVKVARGAALGTALDFFPIPLVSIPVAYLLARLTGFNGVAAALAAAFFKWAVPFFYLFNFAVGQLIIGDWAGTVAVFNGQAQVTWSEAFNTLGYPFFVGSLCNSLVAGGTVYFTLRRFLEFRRRRRQEKKKQKGIDGDLLYDPQVDKDGLPAECSHHEALTGQRE